MKNNLPFAAMTAAFTIAGAATGYGLRENPEFCAMVVVMLVGMGGFAAALSGQKGI